MTERSLPYPTVDHGIKVLPFFFVFLDYVNREFHGELSISFFIIFFLDFDVDEESILAFCKFVAMINFWINCVSSD